MLKDNEMYNNSHNELIYLIGSGYSMVMDLLF